MVNQIIFLVGMPGVGKTTMGKQLAQHFGAQLMDTDELIEKHTHQTIPVLIQETGEVYFRALERKMLDRVVRQKKLTICSTGGGLVANDENLSIMKQFGTVVYLKASTTYILNHLINDTKVRPLLHELSDVALSNLLVAREVYYNQSHFIFDVENNPIEDLINLIDPCNINP